jgi:hypothetical protein
MVEKPPVEEALTARQWASTYKIPYAVILAAVKEGRLDAMRFSDRGQIYIMPSSMEKFLDEARQRVREQAVE